MAESIGLIFSGTLKFSCNPVITVFSDESLPSPRTNVNLSLYSENLLITFFKAMENLKTWSAFSTQL